MRPVRSLCRAEMPQDTEAGTVVVSPDGTRLACSWPDGERGRIAVLDATSGKQTAECDGHRGGVWACVFSPDGTRLASAGEDNMARAVGRGHRSIAGHVPGAHEQGLEHSV